MKTLYFDSNYVFRLYSSEPGAAEVQALADQAASLATARKTTRQTVSQENNVQPIDDQRENE